MSEEASELTSPVSFSGRPKRTIKRPTKTAIELERDAVLYNRGQPKRGRGRGRGPARGRGRGRGRGCRSVTTADSVIDSTVVIVDGGLGGSEKNSSLLGDVDFGADSDVDLGVDLGVDTSNLRSGKWGASYKPEKKTVMVSQETADMWEEIGHVEQLNLTEVGDLLVELYYSTPRQRFLDSAKDKSRLVPRSKTEAMKPEPRQSTLDSSQEKDKSLSQDEEIILKMPTLRRWRRISDAQQLEDKDLADFLVRLYFIAFPNALNVGIDLLPSSPGGKEQPEMSYQDATSQEMKEEEVKIEYRVLDLPVTSTPPARTRAMVNSSPMDKLLSSLWKRASDLRSSQQHPDDDLGWEPIPSGQGSSEAAPTADLKQLRGSTQAAQESHMANESLPPTKQQNSATDAIPVAAATRTPKVESTNKETTAMSTDQRRGRGRKKCIPKWERAPMVVPLPSDAPPDGSKGRNLQPKRERDLLSESRCDDVQTDRKEFSERNAEGASNETVQEGGESSKKRSGTVRYRCYAILNGKIYSIKDPVKKKTKKVKNPAIDSIVATKELVELLKKNVDISKSPKVGEVKIYLNQIRKRARFLWRKAVASQKARKRKSRSKHPSKPTKIAKVLNSDMMDDIIQKEMEEEEEEAEKGVIEEEEGEEEKEEEEDKEEEEEEEEEEEDDFDIKDDPKDLDYEPGRKYTNKRKQPHSSGEDKDTKGQKEKRKRGPRKQSELNWRPRKPMKKSTEKERNIRKLNRILDRKKRFHCRMCLGQYLTVNDFRVHVRDNHTDLLERYDANLSPRLEASLAEFNERQLRSKLESNSFQHAAPSGASRQEGSAVHAGAGERDTVDEPVDGVSTERMSGTHKDTEHDAEDKESQEDGNAQGVDLVDLGRPDKDGMPSREQFRDGGQNSTSSMTVQDTSSGESGVGRHINPLDGSDEVIFETLSDRADAPSSAETDHAHWANLSPGQAMAAATQGAGHGKYDGCSHQMDITVPGEALNLESDLPVVEINKDKGTLVIEMTEGDDVCMMKTKEDNNTSMMDTQKDHNTSIMEMKGDHTNPSCVAEKSDNRETHVAEKEDAINRSIVGMTSNISPPVENAPTFIPESDVHVLLELCGWCKIMVECQKCGKIVSFNSMHCLYNWCVALPCDKCHKKVSTVRGLELHKARCKLSRKAKLCGICGMMFYDLDNHVKRVHNGKPSGKKQCRFCGERFTPGGLCRHEKIHMNIKSYICSHCGRGFNQSSGLKSHIRQHTQEKPYKCLYCEKAFTHNVSLKAHTKRYHGIDMWALQQTSRAIGRYKRKGDRKGAAAKKEVN